jgi:hypothetical protein
MNDDYKRLRERADHLFRRFNDTVDNGAAAGSLAAEIRNVVEDFEMSKSPRSIDDRVKRVMEGLDELKRSGPDTMDYGDIDELHDGYEDLRGELRDLDNY